MVETQEFTGFSLPSKFHRKVVEVVEAVETSRRIAVATDGDDAVISRANLMGGRR